MRQGSRSSWSSGRCGKHAGALAKSSFFMCFARAVPRVNLLAISIKLAISIYFDCAPAISIAILIISIYFDQFDLFRSFRSTMKLTTIERFFPSRFSRDFRTKISGFVPVLRKPCRMDKENHQKRDEKLPP
jgi:hypothetical protein